MKNSRIFLMSIFSALALSIPAYTQVEVNEAGEVVRTPSRRPASAPTQSTQTEEWAPRTGRKEASKFFGGSKSRRPAATYSRDHYLALHVGTFFSSDSYKWGDKEHARDPGKMNAGVTYRIGEWTNSMDLLFRADFISYDLAEGKPLKMSLLPLIIFPEANSRFPLYFGIGAGLGVFFKQLPQESVLSFDYQLLAGVRLFELVESTGFFVETGLKNHINLLSDGQFNSVSISVGAIFSF